MAGYKKVEPLYGSPRGNAVMKAKRITGPSANASLRLHVLLERCAEAGCKEPVLATRNPDGTTTIRTCAKHLGRKKGKNVPRTRAW